MCVLERFHDFRVERLPTDRQARWRSKHIQDARTRRSVRRARDVHDVRMLEPAFVTGLPNKGHEELPLARRPGSRRLRRPLGF
jgi:ribosomal protein L32E